MSTQRNSKTILKIFTYLKTPPLRTLKSGKFSLLQRITIPLACSFVCFWYFDCRKCLCTREMQNLYRTSYITRKPTILLRLYRNSDCNYKCHNSYTEHLASVVKTVISLQRVPKLQRIPTKWQWLKVSIELTQKKKYYNRTVLKKHELKRHQLHFLPICSQSVTWTIKKIRQDTLMYLFLIHPVGFLWNTLCPIIFYLKDLGDWNFYKMYVTKFDLV